MLYIDGVDEVVRESLAAWDNRETIYTISVFVSFPFMLSCDSEKFTAWLQLSLWLQWRDCNQHWVMLKIPPYSWLADKWHLRHPALITLNTAVCKTVLFCFDNKNVQLYLYPYIAKAKKKGWTSPVTCFASCTSRKGQGYLIENCIGKAAWHCRQRD